MNRKIRRHLVQAIAEELGVVGFMAPMATWFLRTQRAEDAVELPVGSTALATRVRDAISLRGTLVDSEKVDLPRDAICGIIGSGWKWRNPTFVTATIRETQASQSTLGIEATALEGLLSQSSARNAVSRLLLDVMARLDAARSQ